MKIHKKKRLLIRVAVIILVLSAITVTIAAPPEGFKIKADTLDDALFRTCDGYLNDFYNQPSKVPDRLNALYGNPLPAATSGYDLDFDYYSGSWQNYPGGRGETMRQKLVKLKPQIIAQIKNIYGDPYKNNKVYVVYDNFFRNNFDTDYRSLNEYNIDASGIYMPNQNLIILGPTTDENWFLHIAIHETTHSFNTGAVQVFAYEEGMAESVSRIVSKSIHGLSFNPKDEYAGLGDKNILATTYGLFATIDNSEVLAERYDAASKLMYELYQSNNNFYKNFRNQYPVMIGQATFQKILANPVAYGAEMTGKSICAELTDTSTKNNKLVPYMTAMQNFLNRIGDPTIIRNNKISNLQSASNLDIDGTFDSYQGKFFLTSKFRYTGIVDILLALYHSKNADFRNQIPIKTFVRTLSGIKFTDATVLTKVIEIPADEMKITYGYANETNPGASTKSAKTKTLGKNSYQPRNIGSYTPTLKDLTGDDRFTGTVNITIDSKIRIYRGKRTDDCTWYRVCYTDGIQSRAQDLTASRSYSFYFKNGLVIPQLPPGYTPTTGVIFGVNTYNFKELEGKIEIKEAIPGTIVKNAYLTRVPASDPYNAVRPDDGSRRRLIITAENSSPGTFAGLATVGYPVYDVIEAGKSYRLEIDLRKGNDFDGDLEIGYFANWDSGRSFVKQTLVPYNNKDENATKTYTMTFTTPSSGVAYKQKPNSIFIGIIPGFKKKSSTSSPAWIDVRQIRLIKLK